MARYPQIDQALERTRRQIRLRGYSQKTEDTYLGVIRRFLHFNRRCAPEVLTVSHFRAYMTHLADERRVAAATRNQAASAISFSIEGWSAPRWARRFLARGAPARCRWSFRTTRPCE